MGYSFFGAGLNSHTYLMIVGDTTPKSQRTIFFSEYLHKGKEIIAFKTRNIMASMKKDFVVARIEAAQDGSPYVYVGFSDPNDYKNEKPMNPFGSNVMAFSSPEDMMKNLPKAMGNISRMMTGGGASDSPTFKISVREYEDIGIRVGDKVTIEIRKADNNLYT